MYIQRRGIGQVPASTIERGFYTEADIAEIVKNAIQEAMSAYVVEDELPKENSETSSVSGRKLTVTQPVATFKMSNGNTVSFSTIFGEVPKDTSTAYYYFGQPIIRKEDEPGIEYWWC